MLEKSISACFPRLPIWHLCRHFYAWLKHCVVNSKSIHLSRSLHFEYLKTMGTSKGPIGVIYILRLAMRALQTLMKSFSSVRMLACAKERLINHHHINQNCESCNIYVVTSSAPPITWVAGSSWTDSHHAVVDNSALAACFYWTVRYFFRKYTLVKVNMYDWFHYFKFVFVDMHTL